MLPVEILIPFFIASLLLALAPGPDNLFVLTQSALHGPAAGLLVMLGLCTGLVVHSLAVALGIAVIFQTSAAAFTAVKVVGAGYLLYLAWQSFRSGGEAAPEGRPREALRPGQLYRRGIIMNLTNPKVAVFFLAFLPQFADPARGPLSVQLLLLGGAFIVATVLVFGSVALLSGVAGAWLGRSESVRRILHRVAGMVFLGLALKLATSRR